MDVDKQRIGDAVESSSHAVGLPLNCAGMGLPIVKRARRISKPWQVMVKGKYIGCYAKREEAAEAAYAAGWERKNPKALRSKRYLRHVVHRPNRKCPWQVVIRRKYVGSYRTQSLAAVAAAKHNGETPSSLVRGGRRRSVELSRRCFVGFWKAYKTKGSCTQCLPEDLKHLFRCKTILNDPWMVAYAILAKYGPHRDALCKAYAEWFDPNSSDMEAQTYCILQKAVANIQDIPPDDMAKWHRGPGKHAAYYSGLSVYITQSLKLLKRDGRIAVLTPEYRKAFRKIHKFGETLLTVKGTLSLTEWCEATERCRAAAKGVAGFRGPTAYRTLSTIRCWQLFCQHRDCQDMGLQYPQDTNVERLISIFPDKCSHLKELARGREHDMKLSVLLKQIEYPAPRPDCMLHRLSAQICCLYLLQRQNGISCSIVVQCHPCFVQSN